MHGDVSYTCETAGYFYLYQVSFHDLENRFHWEQIVWWGFMPFQRHARLKHKARTPTQTKREVVLDPRFRLRNRWKYSSNQLTLFGTQRGQSVSHDLHDFLHCSMHVFPQNTVSRWCLSKVTLDQDFKAFLHPKNTKGPLSTAVIVNSAIAEKGVLVRAQIRFICYPVFFLS